MLLERPRLKRFPVGSIPKTVAEALKVYCATISARKASRGALYAAKHLDRLLGDVGLDDITREHCRAYAATRRAEPVRGNHNNSRRRHVGDGTILKELSVLRAAINHVKPKHGSIFEFPRQPAPRNRRLTHAEFDRLLAAADTQHLRVFLELAAATGARSGALLQLTWAQLDFEHGLIDLGRGAGNKRRATVPMTKRLRQLLGTLHATWRPKPEDHVLTFREGKGVSSVRTAFRRAAKRAGLQGVTPHVIRHSAACWMAEAGVPMSEIAAFLGHTDSRITERVYAKYSPTYLRRAAAALDRE